MTYSEKIDAVAEYAEKLSCTVLRGEALSSHTSVRVGGACDLMILSTDPMTSARLKSRCKELSLYSMVIGNGSNCLFSDDGFRGVIIAPAARSGSVSVKGNIITADAGVQLSAVCKTALDNGLTGLEFAYGIPGTVGGAVYMNAGAYGGEISRVIRSVTAADSSGKLIAFTPEELSLGYRTSRFEHTDEVIISAEFALEPGDPAAISSKMEELISRRHARQPLEYPSFGSAFKRPEGTYAGLVIEESGLKGTSVGGAQISPKHANFIINKGGATASDILSLIRLTQKTVAEKTGFFLEPEVRLIPPEPEDKKGDK